MPMIDGIKVACENCIRGHRSTKCTHIKERRMVEVRKPGRPLTTCSHPGDRPCRCGTVTVAMRRNQSCHTCTEVPTPPSVQPRPTAETSVSSPSPMRVTFSVAPNKVQKSTSRPASRKMSFNPAYLEKFDLSGTAVISQPGIRSPVSTTPQTSKTMASCTETNGYPMQGFPFTPGPAPYPYSPVSGSPMTNGYYVFAQPQPDGTVIYNHAFPQPPMQRLYAMDTDGENKSPTAMTPQPSATMAARSCCGNGTPSQTQTEAMPPPAAEDIPTHPDVKPSCCSSKNNIASTSSNGSRPPNHINGSLAKFDAGEFSSTSTSIPPAPYIPGYTSYTKNDQFMKQPPASEWTQPEPPNSLSPMHYETKENGCQDACGCGDDCQCLACIVHPQNETTKNHFFELWRAQANEPLRTPHSATFQMNGLGHITPPTAASPSDNGSASVDDSNDLNLSLDDYFLVNYPLEGTDCAGDQHTCPCGDDCACIGCTIHGTGRLNQMQTTTTAEQENLLYQCGGVAELCLHADNCPCDGCLQHGGQAAVASNSMTSPHTIEMPV